MALAVGAYLLRRRDRKRLVDFPAATLGAGLLLLVATPSKWPWHFGALIGIAAVAVAAETARLREQADHSRSWDLWPLLAVGATVVAASWSWFERNVWNTLDLRGGDWVASFESTLSVSTMAASVPVLLLAGALVVEARHRRQEGYARAPWRAASWSAPALAVPLVAFAIAMIVSDAAGTHSWTLTRQNFDYLRGKHTCGLADDALAAISADRSTLVMPDLVMYLPCAKHPTLQGGIVTAPDHLVTSNLWGYGIGYATSPFSGLLDLYPLKPVPLHGVPESSVRLFRAARPIPGMVEAIPTVERMRS